MRDWLLVAVIILIPPTTFLLTAPMLLKAMAPCIRKQVELSCADRKLSRAACDERIRRLVWE